MSDVSKFSCAAASNTLSLSKPYCLLDSHFATDAGLQLGTMKAINEVNTSPIESSQSHIKHLINACTVQ